MGLKHVVKLRWHLSRYLQICQGCRHMTMVRMPCMRRTLGLWWRRSRCLAHGGCAYHFDTLQMLPKHFFAKGCHAQQVTSWRFSHGGPEYDAKYPDGIPTAIDITLKSGKVPGIDLPRFAEGFHKFLGFVFWTTRIGVLNVKSKFIDSTNKKPTWFQIRWF